MATTFYNFYPLIHKRFISYQSNRKENIHKYSISKKKKTAENPLILKKLKIYIKLPNIFIFHETMFF